MSFLELLEPLESRQLLSVSVKINFQPPSATVPAGYLADGGAVYGSRGNGFTYGWDVANTSYRDRNSALSPDQRYDTLTHTQLYGNRTWSLAVSNGTYTVRVVAGDPAATGSTIRYNLEGALAVSGSTTTTNRWVEGTRTVTVGDGKLTLANGSGAVNNKVCFIEVQSSTAVTNTPPRAPVITEPRVNGEVVSGADVHMETGPFSDPDAGQTHRMTDWEIRRVSNNERVWRALGQTSTAGKVHVHFGDGTFVNSLSGKTELPPDTAFKLRVRHRDNSGATNSWSAWSERTFRTASTVEPIPSAPDWTVDQAGYKVERVPVRFASGEGQFRLPVNIAFVPSNLHRTGPSDPLFYVTELYGKVRVVTNDYTVRTYASNLLNYDPTGPFPGSGEQGLSGLAIDPTNGDLYVGMLYDDNPSDSVKNRWPKVTRLRSSDGGLTASSRTDILRMPGEQQGQSHQVSNITFGPDGKLYVHNGDGLGTPETALNLNSFRGKVLRMSKDGSAPGDNPFYDSSNGITARDYVYAYGLRNPFGGAWRPGNGQHYQVENGPGVDRLSKVRRGVSYGWNGSSSTMSTNAIYNWSPAAAPVNIAFVDGRVFGGSRFPTSKWDHAFVTESGPTYATGPQSRGKRISEFVISADGTNGSLVSGPRTLAHYTGNGKGTAVALAAGPDGLYFSDFYEDDPVNGTFNPTNAGANILRVVYTGA
ncbi:MAG TPA: PQQ-dependent sugar dehydrogenase [Tepidisphaeraceae bacterium]|nr:PQQ-dependent sugar dehydrogenase [Tepidisphaeraceae bacterium]